jgi:hypothetical protein
MKKYLLLGSLLAIVLFVIPVTIWSRVSLPHNAHSGGVPRNVLVTANNWMAENTLPHINITATYTALGKGVWEIKWIWRVASGTVYGATLIIKNTQILNVPVIEETTWPF